MIPRAARNSLGRMLAFLAMLELLVVPAILLWPDVLEVMEKSPQIRLFAEVPVLGRMVTQIEETGILGYVASQHFLKGCSLLGAIAAVLFAAGAVAGEAQRGTLEAWLARPVSRARLLLERYFLGVVEVSVPVLLSTWTIPFWLERIDEDLSTAGLMLCAVHECAFLVAAFSLTFLLSSMGRQPIRIAFVVLSFVAVELALYFVDTVTDWSVFRLADMNRFLWIYRHRALEWEVVAVLAGASALSLAGALVAFHRRVP